MQLAGLGTEARAFQIFIRNQAVTMPVAECCLAPAHGAPIPFARSHGIADKLPQIPCSISEYTVLPSSRRAARLRVSAVSKEGLEKVQRAISKFCSILHASPLQALVLHALPDLWGKLHTSYFCTLLCIGLTKGLKVKSSKSSLNQSIVHETLGSRFSVKDCLLQASMLQCEQFCSR